MITPSFNLLDEPWIPVRTPTGQVFEVTLTDALLRARDYADLAETAPPNLVALYRLLLAVLHRSLTTQLGRWTDRDRARWFAEGLPGDPVRAYLAAWRERFWLFHPTEPFMQVAALADAEETRDRFKIWTQVAIDKPTPSEPAVFDHAMDTLPTKVRAARVLRDLLGYLQFVPGKLVQCLKVADKAGALANTAAVVPTGSNLERTLLLGLHPFDGRRLDDLPSWERIAPSVADLRGAATLASGPVDRYTRLSRAVLLSVDTDPHEVVRLRFAAGMALLDDPNAPDPMACYRIGADGKPVRVSYSEGRAIWRDLPSLVPDASRSKDIPAAILAWAAGLYSQLGQPEAPVQVLTAGLASKEAKMLRWRVDRLDLPLPLLMQADAAELLRTQVRHAEEVFRRVRGVCSEMIAETMPDPKHADTRARARTIFANGPAASVFFSAAERGLPKLMQQIAAGEIDAADSDWNVTLADAARRSWGAARLNLGDSSQALRADARTWPKLRHLLQALAPSVPPSMLSEETRA